MAFELFIEQALGSQDQLMGALSYYGQTFTPAVNFTCTKVAVKLRDNESGGQNFSFALEIRSTDPENSDFPSVIPALTSQTIDLSNITAKQIDNEGSWEEFVLDTSVVLTAGTIYGLVLHPLAAATGTDPEDLAQVYWDWSNANNVYAGGLACISAGSEATWGDTGSNVRDREFRLYGDFTTSTVTPDTDRTFNKSLVVVGSDTLFYESSGALVELGAVNNEGDIDCTNLLQMSPAYQKAFIVNEGILRVADFGNVKIVAANIVSGGVYPRKGALLTSGTSSMVVDYITSTTGESTIYGQNITGIAFTASDAVTGTNLDGTSVGFTMTAVNEVAGPHWYTWAVYGALAATYGAMPNFASLICLYRGRIVISGNKQYPFQWYMARQGNPFDFNYTSNDAQTAVAGSNADAGELGDIVTALIPYKDDYLVFGCGSQIWYMAGDPAAGGSLNELDLTTGIYGPQSWCFDNAGNLYFWGTNGVYRTTIPGVPENISRVYLPNLVKDEAVDSSTHRITMAYDPRRGGILIAITKFSDNTHSNYFFDLATNGFFPESSATTDCAIYSQLFYQGDAPDYRRLLLGCADGYVRYHDEDTKSDVDADDVATAINAYCTWGPLKLAQDEDFYGILSALEIITAGGASGGSQSDSNNVSYNIFVANTAEEVLEKLSANTDYRVTGTVTAPGRPKGARIRKRFRAMYLGLRLWNSTAAEAWSVNKIIGTIKKGGKFK